VLLLFIGISSGFPAIHHDLQLAALRLEHDALAAHVPHHVQRGLRFAVQRDLPHVLGNVFLHYLPHFLLDREEAVRREKTLDPLMGALVVVILHPPGDPFGRAFERLEARLRQELRPDRFPEALDLPQRHGVMRRTADVMHPVAGQGMLEVCLPLPGGVLPAVVRQHLLGGTVLAHSPAIDLQHVLRSLAAVDAHADDEPGVVVNEPDQVGVVVVHLEAEDVALPHLVGCGALKEPRLGRVLPRLLPHLRQRDFLPVQGLANGLRTGRQEERPL
jgi:hypothetical protein